MRCLYFTGLLLLAACSPKVVSTPSVTFVSRDAQGIVSLKATGYGGNQAEREQSAQKAAFETLLFKGLPSAESSALRLPMIEKEEERTRHAAFFQDFFEKNGMKEFVQAMTVLDYRARASNHEKAQHFSLKINYDALRRHLEEKGVIRKFGY